MAVYTPITPDDVIPLLAALQLGPLQACEPIGSGIENTNYFVTTEDGAWVLTLFERLEAAQLPYYLRLMQHLAQRGLPVPEPRANAEGALVHHVAGKPAALVNRLPGRSVEAPDVHHVAQLGATLARMHQAVADFPLHQDNLRGPAWREHIAPAVLPHLNTARQTLLRDELVFQQHLSASAVAHGLPAGAVHADLFRDNALFDGLPGRERLSGVFDFYFAGHDHFAYDLAVVLNDWCIDLDSGQLDPTRAQALIDAYRQERPPHGAEWLLLPGLRRAAALRFWLSRLADWHLPRPAHVLQPKPPEHFERVLRACIDTPWHPVL